MLETFATTIELNMASEHTLQEKSSIGVNNLFTNVSVTYCNLFPYRLAFDIVLFVSTAKFSKIEISFLF